MKKTIVIVILVVYIASIAVVNFFGLKIKEFDHVEYVQEIKCESITVLNENPTTYTAAKLPPEVEIPEFRFKFTKGTEAYTKDPASLANNPNVVRLNYEVLPHLADETKITFIFEENESVYFDEATKTFVFLKAKRSIIVTIKATDGSDIQTTIKIWSI